jgi:hypothetical protein
VKTLALAAAAALCLALLTSPGSAFAEGDGPYIEVHRMGLGPGPDGPVDLAPGNGYGPLERARIRERVAVDDWDVVVLPDQGDPDEDPADDGSGILDDADEGSSGDGLVYPDPSGGGVGSGTWVAPSPGAEIPEPATVLIAAFGGLAWLLGVWRGRRRSARS